MLGGDEFISIVRALGAHRVLFGTDSPWGERRASLSDLRALPLTTAEKEAILGGNAAKMLNISQSAVVFP